MRWQWHIGLGRELGLAFWATVFLEATFGAYISVWPLWIEQLGAPITVVGLVLGASGIIRPFVLGPSSALAERFGTRRLILATRSCAILGLLVAAMAQSWPILLVTVMTNALGELAFPFLHAYVADNAGEQRVRAFALIITVGPSLALMVSPLLAGALIALFDIPAALVMAAVTTAVALGFISRMRFTEAHERSDADGDATYGAAFREPEVRRIFITHGLTLISLALGTALIPNFLSDMRGLNAATISALAAGGALGSALFGIFITRNRPLQGAPFVGAAIAVFSVVVSLVLFASQSALPLIAMAFVLRGGFFSTWALFLAALGESAPSRLRSRAFTVVEILGGSALSFAPVVAALLYRIEPVTPIVVSAITSALIIPFILYGHRKRRQSLAKRPQDAAPIATPLVATEHEGTGG